MKADEFVRDSRQLLHRVDPTLRRMEFRPTSEEALRDASFIDGRSDIWAGEPITQPFAAVRGLETTTPSGSPFIFHMSFCGSTLLARLLDAPGKVIALKEPNCLVDNADWESALRRSNANDADFEPLLRFTVAMLERPFAPGEQVLIKPSSWANNLLPSLARLSIRALFVTIARETFLEAVLRGGAPRLAFAARLAAHLGSDQAVHSAIESTDDPIGKTARLALLAHQLQAELFSSAIQSGLLESNGTVDFALIEGDPLEAAQQAATSLGLPLDPVDLKSNCARWAKSNAKADAPFDVDRRRSENAHVRDHYASLIDSALLWADDALGTAGL